jgi:hypothetical protein
MVSIKEDENKIDDKKYFKADYSLIEKIIVDTRTTLHEIL